MVRLYPSVTRLTSSNFDPVRYWGVGVQIVAINWQSCGEFFHFPSDPVVWSYSSRLRGADQVCLEPIDYCRSRLHPQRSDVRAKRTIGIRPQARTPPNQDEGGEHPADQARPYDQSELHFKSALPSSMPLHHADLLSCPPAFLQIISAQQLPPLPLSNNILSSFISPDKNLDPYVSLSLHAPTSPPTSSTPSLPSSTPRVSPTPILRTKTRSIADNGFNPVWNESRTLSWVGAEGMDDLAFVRFEVRHDPSAGVAGGEVGGDGDDGPVVAGYCSSVGSLNQGQSYRPYALFLRASRGIRKC
jgi:hypothetical protein